MSIFKCKMCGGDLNLTEGMTVAECEYCGSVQTVPSADSEKKLTLFARANRLRAGCEFDKAAGVYETIVADFPEEAEAYWGLVLCKYGIEYVDDPATGKKIPTCHRSSFNSVLEDSDFEQACENADTYARRVYRDEAKQIETLRKDIISVSANEKPYDIFICYKETAENGERTLDSVLAQDIYDALTGKGYRVFFSRVTLEDKLGVEYEPYIFAALNSAKVMLAVGTDYEYYNAVWVKNEWSRYLKLMEQDKGKHLIPCFKGIDAYDMPKEFARLQAQDMGKVGAMQDLLRGVEKLMGKTGADTAPAVAAAPTTNPTVDSLLKRVFMYLEDGEWKSADEYCEKVLDIDPENAQAYLGKLMAELEVKKPDDFKAYIGEPFDKSRNYEKVLRFGDAELSESLVKSNTEIPARRENVRLNGIYREAKETMERALTEDAFLAAAEQFESIGNYENSAVLAEKCRKQGAKKAVQYKANREKMLPLIEKQRTRYIDWCIATGAFHTVGLKADCTVVATGNNNHGQCNVSGWRSIVAVSAGGLHTVGLRADGTVIATGNNNYGQCDVSGWTDIVAVVAGSFHTVGLKADSTVVATGNNNHGQCNVSDWRNIVAVSAGSSHTVGLKADGTVISTGENEHGQCDVSGWTDIVAVEARKDCSFGLKADGTVVASGDNKYGNCNVSDWTDIVEIIVHSIWTVGLKADGTIVITRKTTRRDKDLQWTDIVAISADTAHIVGLKADGTLVATGENDFGQCDVSSWRNIVVPKAAIAQRRAQLRQIKEAKEEERKREEEDRLYRMFLRQEEELAERKRREAEEEARRKREEEEWERRKREEAERKRRVAEETARRERAALVSKLQQEQAALETELANLKGLFTGKRRKEIEARLAEIKREIARNTV